MPSVPIPSLADLPKTIPVFPLSGALLLPRGRLPLNIFEPRYLAMVDTALRSTRVIGMVQPMSEEERKPKLYPVGCLGRLTSWSDTGDGRFFITLSGAIRFRIAQELKSATPYREVEADYTPYAGDLNDADDDNFVDRRRLGICLQSYMEQRRIDADLSLIDRAPAETLINTLAMICPFAPAEKQALLEAKALSDRAELLTTLIEMATAGHGGTVQ
jgi:Lon protease-like protein